MIGLLYKDFLAIKGRIYRTAIILQFFLIMVLRLLIRDDQDIDMILGCIVMVTMIVAVMLLIFFMETGLIKADDGRKQRQYYLSLPINRKQYVASKYLFLLLTLYIFISIISMEVLLCKINLASEYGENLLNALTIFLTIILGLCMFIFAVELPFYFGLGVKKGIFIKKSLVFLLFFLGMVYLLFGDLTFYDQFDIMSVLDYILAHPEIYYGVQVFVPFAGGIAYCISYQISSRLFERRGWEDE